MHITIKTTPLTDGSKLPGIELVIPYQSPALQGEAEKLHLPCRDYRSAVTLAHQLTRLINEHTVEVCEFK